MRKPIAVSIALGEGNEVITVAACDDGTLWTNQSGPWTLLNKIPQAVEPKPSRPPEKYSPF